MLVQITLLVLGLCYTQVKADAVTDANNLLNDLRQTINATNTDAYVKHFTMAFEVDSVAFATKITTTSVLNTLVKIYRADCTDVLPASTADLTTCVNTKATEALDFIAEATVNSSQIALKLSYDNEKKLVSCQATDEACLNAVMDSIQADIDSIPGTIAALLEADQEEVNARLQEIEACAVQAEVVHYIGILRCLHVLV